MAAQKKKRAASKGDDDDAAAADSPSGNNNKKRAKKTNDDEVPAAPPAFAAPPFAAGGAMMVPPRLPNGAPNPAWMAQQAAAAAAVAQQSTAAQQTAAVQAQVVAGQMQLQQAAIAMAQSTTDEASKKKKATKQRKGAPAPPTGFIALECHQRIVAEERQRASHGMDMGNTTMHQMQTTLEAQQAEIDKLTLLNTKLQEELATAKSQLEEAEKGKSKIEKEVAKTAKRATTLEQRLQKQKEKWTEERKKQKETKKELVELKKSNGFNQCTKIVLPGDAEREDIEHNKHDRKWQQKFDMLVQFKEEHGHTNVSKYTDNVEAKYPGLATWVSTQRTCFTWLKSGKKNTLTPFRLQKLKSIGFEWQPRGVDPVPFDERVEQLKVYKQEHGDCNVQQHYKGVAGLGNWVLGMRRYYRENRLPADRIALLETMGFVWRLRAVKVPGGRHKKKNNEDEDDDDEPSELHRRHPQQQQPPPQQQHHHHHHHHANGGAMDPPAVPLGPPQPFSPLPFRYNEYV
ncbi:helicase [Seminavis robusta]|uniref:Helicase n=1 Tax=Seminavis robusta TaxID=568900 RepID=A0A9N8EDP6_9STRA|nr:helicase [Seminavis robusta]|eukprot:Sro1025_g232780.1 helicase (514) ;mRNA; r:18304-19845